MTWLGGALLLVERHKIIVYLSDVLAEKQHRTHTLISLHLSFALNFTFCCLGALYYPNLVSLRRNVYHQIQLIVFLPTAVIRQFAKNGCAAPAAIKTTLRLESNFGGKPSQILHRSPIQLRRTVPDPESEFPNATESLRPPSTK
uniref:(northern house mosquito) hypothetical protein n=1 Tax=Culex pipiens TaxID=7175 RepID=A0A8D8DPI5_CULPI